jgi:glycerophosphoryl diester phosphodiesterase
VRLYGHRGAGGECPENTLEAFRHAIAHGVDGIETDIAMTADLVPVLHHDAELPDGRLICSLRKAELPSHIPSLAEALAIAPDTEWLLEIKTYPPRPEKSHSPALVVEKLLAVRAKFPTTHVVIMAFDWAVLREMAVQAPGIRRACLTSPRTSLHRGLWWGPGFARTKTPAAVAATGAYAWSAYHDIITQGQIAQAHALGLKVFLWTVNDGQKFARLAPLVDGIITDFPARFGAKLP